MKRINCLAAALPMALLQACATPQPASTDGVSLTREEAAIPFFNASRNAVTSWQSDGQEGLWIQDGRREWYYAKLIGPCLGIANAMRLGFDTGTSDRLDRYSKVIVPGQPTSCTIASFTKSDPPPDGKRRTLEGEEVR